MAGVKPGQPLLRGDGGGGEAGGRGGWRQETGVYQVLLGHLYLGQHEREGIPEAGRGGEARPEEESEQDPHTGCSQAASEDTARVAELLLSFSE